MSRLPDYVAPTPPAVVAAPPPRPVGRALTQATRAELNEVAVEPSVRQGTVAASGTIVPLVFGQTTVGGKIFAHAEYLGDLVLGVMWCKGEIQSIENVWINDEAVPVAVTQTDYLGTSSQTYDATLAAAIAAYDDDLVGIAYSVFVIPAAEIGGWPRFRAEVKGLKLYDPRTTLTAYSDNPALALYYLITNEDDGAGMTARGTDDVADRCDEVLEGLEKRNLIGLEVGESRDTFGWISVLAAYAECFWCFEDEAIRLIPDAPVDTITVTIGPADMVEGSFAMEALDITAAPTEVEVRYTDSSGAVGEPWTEQGATSTTPGVDTGVVPRVPSVVRMEGVTRFSEASRKAASRRLKAALVGAYSWLGFDDQLYQQKGDVVYLDYPAWGLADRPVRITDVSMERPGRYRVTARDYSADVYPDDVPLPEGTGVLPVGAIILSADGTVPDGFEAYDTANGKYILGAGGTYAIGATGGALTHAGFSGNTSTDPMHPADLSPYSYPHIKYTVGGSVSGDLETDPGVMNHNHSYTISTITPDLYRRHNKLIKKITTGTTSIPAECYIMGLDTIASGVAERITAFSNRFLVADSANSNAGQALGPYINLASTGSYNGNHFHHSASGLLATDFDFGTNPNYTPSAFNTTHSHNYSGRIDRNTKRRYVALYGKDADFPVVAGMICLFEGGTIPTDWSLCDGTSGTPDFRDYFIVLAGATTPAAAGDNTLSVDFTTTSSAHYHNGTYVETNRVTEDRPHTSLGHTHTIQASDTWLPPYYALAVIMYQGPSP